MYSPETGGIPHDYIIVMCPPNLLHPHVLKGFTFEKKPKKKLLSMGTSHEIKDEGKSDTKRDMLDGDLKFHSIDKDLHFSISNGLVSKKVGTTDVYRIFKERPVWFCEKDVDSAVKNIYSVDTFASARRGCVVLKQYLDSVGQRKPCKVVHNIARITKLDMSYEVRGTKALLQEMEALSASSSVPADFDRCLQFALCGEHVFFPIGRFGFCKNGNKK